MRMFCRGQTEMKYIVTFIPPASSFLAMCMSHKSARREACAAMGNGKLRNLSCGTATTILYFVT